MKKATTKRLCIKCGKRIAVFRGFCEHCYLETHPLMHAFKGLRIKLCTNCDSAFVRNKWVNYTGVNELIKDLIKEKIKISPEVLKMEIESEVELKKNPGTIVNSEAMITLYSRLGKEKQVVKDEYAVPVKIEINYCNRCSLKGTKYFEGILQLRNPDDDVVEFIRNKVKDVAGKGIFVADVKEVRGGVDFYITSKKYIQSLGREIVDNFGGHLSINPQLFSRNKETSRDIYRVNVLVKLPDFKKGEFVEIDSEAYKVIGVGKKITIKKLSDNTRKEADLSRIKVNVLKKKNTVVSKTRPNVEVIHPDNFQSVEAGNKVEGLKPGDLVEVVVADGRVYVV